MPESKAHPWFRVHPVSPENIVWHWRQATRDEIAQGMRWYADAHHVATVIAHGNAHLGAGMLAIYSPQQGWIGNVLNAARVLREGKGIGGPGCGMFATTGQKRAADRLLNGERYEDILSGPKIRDFAHLIEFGGDRDPDNPCVVIDRHALSVAHGRALTSEEYEAAPVNGSRRKDGSISRRHYDHVVSLYHRAAEQLSALAGGADLRTSGSGRDLVGPPTAQPGSGAATRPEPVGQGPQPRSRQLRARVERVPNHLPARPGHVPGHGIPVSRLSEVSR